MSLLSDDVFLLLARLIHCPFFAMPVLRFFFAGGNWRRFLFLSRAWRAFRNSGAKPTYSQNVLSAARFLAQDSELLAKTLTSKLLTFATGRELGFSDRAEVEQIVKASAEKGYGMRDIVHLVVQSEIFRRK